mmetsp:Transcript_11471/g.14431  ORF Transcript_11471/g.14431 Transcript_11471/m.14431 type:complete len:131 (+) Transcript_11471:761-1153(+)
MMHNTPPTWSTYVTGLICAHLIEQGGIAEMERLSELKAKLFYEYIDSTDGFYFNDVDVRFRSRVSVPFRVCQDAEMEKKFAQDAHAAGLIELAGHALVGACRACFYTAMSVEGVRALIDFMERWRRENRG